MFLWGIIPPLADLLQLWLACDHRVNICRWQQQQQHSSSCTACIHTQCDMKPHHNSHSTAAILSYHISKRIWMTAWILDEQKHKTILNSCYLVHIIQYHIIRTTCPQRRGWFVPTASMFSEAKFGYEGYTAGVYLYHLYFNENLIQMEFTNIFAALFLSLFHDLWSSPVCFLPLMVEVVTQIRVDIVGSLPPSPPHYKLVWPKNYVSL